ncbi:MAG: MFS transporter [Coxiellaceae bacterium]|nr:MFS transporter [Coxiellaceae bacterium]
MQAIIKSWMTRRLVGLGWIICTLAAMFYCYEYLLRIEPSVMINPLMREFQVTAGSLGLLVAMYYYAYTPLQAVVGVLTDYFGPRRVLIAAIAFCTAGALIFGETSNVYVAGVGRIMIGVGSAFAFVGVLKLGAVWLHKKYFAIFAGLTTSLGMLGGMFGDVELSKMVQQYGWHHMMMVSVIAGVVLMVLFWLFVHDKKHDASKDRAVAHPPMSMRMIMVGFLSMFKSRQLWVAGLVGCVLYMSLTVIAEMWGIPFIQSMHPGAHLLAAKLNSMIFFGWLVGSPLTGWVSNKMKSRKKPMIVGTLLSAILISIVIFAQPQNTFILSTLLFFFGVFSSAEILVFVIARESVRVGLVATAVGFINLLVMLGGMIIQPIVGKFLDWGWSGTVTKGVHMYQTMNYEHALILVPVFLVIACVMAMTLKESYSE